jgi:hypothetical protein
VRASRISYIDGCRRRTPGSPTEKTGAYLRVTAHFDRTMILPSQQSHTIAYRVRGTQTPNAATPSPSGLTQPADCPVGKDDVAAALAIGYFRRN